MGCASTTRCCSSFDGGKGIRKALRDVFGARAIVQRCLVHKARNLRDHVPKARRAYVARQMRGAHTSTSASVAKKKLMQLASLLESNGEDSAAASLREGLDETLTTLRLKRPQGLAGHSQLTNAIENMNLGRVMRNIKRWRDEAMIPRWLVLGATKAQRGFWRVKGYRQVAALIVALRGASAAVENEKQVA